MYGVRSYVRSFHSPLSGSNWWHTKRYESETALFGLVCPCSLVKRGLTYRLADTKHKTQDPRAPRQIQQAIVSLSLLQSDLIAYIRHVSTK